jgi:hypothetical protein
MRQWVSPRVPRRSPGLQVPDFVEVADGRGDNVDAFASARNPMTRRSDYRSGVAIALVASALLVWLALGIGIIGRDGDPANRLYVVVLAVGLLGAIIARFRPRGMARALVAMSLAQAMVTAIAVIAGLGLPWSGPAAVVLLNGFFIAAFTVAAWLFRRAAASQAGGVFEG